VCEQRSVSRGRGSAPPEETAGKPVRRTNISYGTIAAAMSGMKEDNSYLTLDKMREYDEREYDFRGGEINDDMVRLREKPGLDSKTKDHLNEEDKVTIVDESSYKEQIGSMNDRWYEVLFADKETEGEAGWVYGAFVNVSGKTD
jgi:hypothetical protein